MRLGTSNTGDLSQSSTGFIKIASGTTAQRPSSPSPGMIRYNTDLGYIEHYLTDWVSVDTQMAHPGFQTGIYYGSPVVDNNPVNSNYFTNGFIYALPFYIPLKSTFNRIGFTVTNYWSTPNISVSIYSNNGGYPDQLLYSVGSIPITSDGNKEISFSNGENCHNKWIWIGIYTDTAINLAAYGWNNTGNYYLGRLSPTAYSSIGAQSSYFTGSMPSTFPGVTPMVNVSPYIWIRNV